jgi:hypothetical protein
MVIGERVIDCRRVDRLHGVMVAEIYRSIAVFSATYRQSRNAASTKIVPDHAIEEILPQVRANEPVHFDSRFSPIANVLTS